MRTAKSLTGGTWSRPKSTIMVPGHDVQIGDTITVTNKAGESSTKVVEFVLRKGEGGKNHPGPFSEIWPLYEARTDAAPKITAKQAVTDGLAEMRAEMAELKALLKAKK